MRNWQSHLTMYDAKRAERFREVGIWNDLLLIDYVESATEATPDKAAIIDVAGQLSYRELSAEAERVSGGLVALGVQKGDVITAQLPNWSQAMVLVVACSRIGAVLNMMSPILRERDVETMLRLAQPRVIMVPSTFRGFGHAAMAAELAKTANPSPAVVVIGDSLPEGTLAWQDLAPQPDTVLPDRPTADEVTQLAFTSGTTGEPKGVLHTANTMLTSPRQYIERCGLGPEQVMHTASTVGHQTGFAFGILCPLIAGATSVLQEVWNGDRFVEQIEQYGLTHTIGAIPYLTDTLEAQNFDKHDTSTLKIFTCIGSGLPASLVQRAKDALPQTKFLGGWGMTETGLSVTNLLSDPIDVVCSVDGNPMPEAELRILDEELDKELPVGTEGNLVMRGPGLFHGFLQREITDVSFIPGGWYKTGDRGYLTPEGQFSMTTRSKDIIVRGGENIPVPTVESLLLAHPAILEAAVVAVPDERLGERACACVVLSEGASFGLDDMKAWLQEQRLTKQFWPEYLVIREGLAKTPSGKIQKFRLREEMHDLPLTPAAKS